MKFVNIAIDMPISRRQKGEALFLDKVKSQIEKMEFFLNSGEKVLDLGSGTGMFAKVLKSKGYSVTPVDVRGYSYYEDIKPIVYNGKDLPFNNNEFDTCLLMAVLHHTPDPEKIINEAMRVSKKLIILEDIYSNPIQKYYTFFIDSVMNKEFFGHPHTNMKDEAWKSLFQKLGLKLKKTEYSKAYIYLQNVTYYLTKD